MAELTDKRLFLLDMDGTLYLDDDLFPGTIPFLRRIREKGGRYLFLTNNSSRGADSYVEKLRRLGIGSVPEDFLTSVDALVLFLRKGDYQGKPLYVAGTESFRRQLRQAGFSVTSDREEAEVLICGFDTELTFQKLEDACILLNRGVEFLATNPDWVCPTWYGYVPDCGSVCEMLYRATGRRPRVIGKPQPEMVTLALERFSCAPQDACLIGDRVYTDIACGKNAGIDTVFVLSGEGVAADCEKYGVQPTWTLPNIQAVLEELG